MFFINAEMSVSSANIVIIGKSVHTILKIFYYLCPKLAFLEDETTYTHIHIGPFRPY